MLSSLLPATNRYVLIDFAPMVATLPTRCRNEDRTQSQWVRVDHPGDDIVLATRKNYIFNDLLPTFKNYSRGKLDSQFEKDFKRAAPSPVDPKFALKWTCNSEPMRRNVPLNILKWKKWNTQHVGIITALFNQRVGIDLCRRIFSVSGENVMVLPKSESFTLELTLPNNGKLPIIKGSAIVHVHGYTKEGSIVQPCRESICISGHYNLISGQVVYVLHKK